MGCTSLAAAAPDVQAAGDRDKGLRNAEECCVTPQQGPGSRTLAKLAHPMFTAFPQLH